MLDIGQLAIQARPEAFDRYGVAERCGGQQLDADVLGQHVGEGQAQLVFAVDSRFGAGDLGTVEAHFAAVFVRLDVRDTGANDKVARLVGVCRDRGGDGKRDKGRA